MKYKKTVIAIILVVLVIIAFLVASNFLLPAMKIQSSKPFYVGIEIGWNSTLAECKSLIDEVKNYTNLLIIASPLILANETLLNETCSYAYNAGMYFMPAYYRDIFNASIHGYAPATWFESAKAQYGDKLLGIYFYDEPGGSQLDETINLTSNNIYNATSQPTSYQDYANWYFHIWTQGNGVPVAANLTQHYDSTLLTADYGLYWFDYELGYNTVLAEFGSNNSRSLQISLVRGAAQAQNKSWGAIITWKYNQTPYLEPPDQMYNDMVFAYNSGASYIAIYDSSQNYTSSTLTLDDYTALKNFWSYVQQNPDKQGSLKADTAIVLPQDYGFGFRSQDDSVWQYHKATSWTQKMYTDITHAITEYKSNLDIVYSDPQFQDMIQKSYSKLLYWPQDFEKGISYPVVDANNSLGYDTIQDAISSFATYEGHTVLVKSGTYQENVNVTKPISLISQNNANTIIEGSNNSTALTIPIDNISVAGFTFQNSGIGILIKNAHNCIISNNTISDNFIGLELENSTGNTLRNNEINGNTFNLITENSSNNSFDASNIIDGKSYTTG